MSFYSSYQRKSSQRERGKTSGVDSRKVNAIFDNFQGEGEDAGVICDENMERFFETLEVEPDGIITLAFAWRIEAKIPGEFSRQEFVNGLTKLRLDSIDKLQGLFFIFIVV